MIWIITGHYGSGKTSYCMYLATLLKKEGKTVSVADLDIVNPYFRLSGKKQLLEEQGINVIASPLTQSTLDIPAIPKEIGIAIGENDTDLILDVGGDDRGSVALGRYANQIEGKCDYSMIYVVNFLRPLTRNASDALQIMKEIENASHLKCQAILDNTNLGSEAFDSGKTSLEAQALSKLSALPLLNMKMNYEEIRELYGKSNI